MFRFLVLATLVSASTATAQVANNIASAGYSQSYATPVAPGQVISLFVKGLNVSNAVASTDPWPTTLGGVRVVVAPNPQSLAYPTAIRTDLRSELVSSGL